MTNRRLLSLHGFAYIDKAWQENGQRKLSLRIPERKDCEEEYQETVWLEADVSDEQLFQLYRLFELYLKVGNILLIEFSANYLLLINSQSGYLTHTEEQVVQLRAQLLSIPRFFVNGRKIETSNLFPSDSMEILDAISLPTS